MGMINKGNINEYIESLNGEEDFKFVIRQLFAENEKLTKVNAVLKQEIDDRRIKPSIDLDEMERQYREYYGDSSNLEY